MAQALAASRKCSEMIFMVHSLVATVNRIDCQLHPSGLKILKRRHHKIKKYELIPLDAYQDFSTSLSPAQSRPHSPPRRLADHDSLPACS